MKAKTEYELILDSYSGSYKVRGKNLRELSEIKSTHTDALEDFYKKHGVGKSIKHKFAFWKSQHPDGYSISHNPTKKQAIHVVELGWLVEKFPADFPCF